MRPGRSLSGPPQRPAALRAKLGSARLVSDPIAGGFDIRTANRLRRALADACPHPFDDTPASSSTPSERPTC